MQHKHRAALLLGVAAVLFGTNAIAVKLAAWNILGTAWIRALGIAVILAIHLLSHRRLSLTRPMLQIICGLFCILSNSLYVVACRYTTAANATLLTSWYPVLPLLFASLAARKLLPRHDLAMLAIAISGVWILLGGEIGLSLSLGNGIALLTGLCFGCHVWFAQKLADDNQVAVSVLFGQLVALLLLPWLVDVSAIAWPNAGQTLWLLALALGSGLPFGLWSNHVRSLPGHISGAILLIEVPVAIVLARFLVSEPLGLNVVFGSVLILISTYRMANYEKSTTAPISSAVIG